jgi:RND family efflux transporter MFP subunit
MSNPTVVSSVEAVRGLEACRTFDGPVKEFWPKFAQTCASLVSGSMTVVLVNINGEWKQAAAAPGGRDFPVGLRGPHFADMMAKATKDGSVLVPSGGPSVPAVVFLALQTGDPKEVVVLVQALPGAAADHALAALAVLKLAADTPLLYQRQRQLERARRDLVNFSQALEILAATNVPTRFLAVAMVLVNELASRHRCLRVSVSWVRGPYLRVVAISGTDKFEKRMSAVQKLEAAMEESRDQDEEIAWPLLPDTDVIARDHRVYVEQENVAALLTVPVRVAGEVRGVIALEREEVFTEYDALALRVIADQVARRLDDLHGHDRWFGARWAAATRHELANFLGPKHTWIKAAAIAGALLLAFSIFVPLPYRVNASFIVRADALMHLPAAYDGYIGEVNVRPGDLVNSGALLVQLDRSDLRVELASALAERQRYSSEAEKAEAERKLSDLRAARALEAQAQARVDLINYRLDRSSLLAPFAGVVVEGDLRERIGAPVKAGDVLLKISQLKGLYVEMKVPERDVDLIADSTRAEVAFNTRPEDTFGVKINRIEPAATVDPEGNIFVVRGTLEDGAEWLRPGMSGVAKIETGTRSLLWICTHRLVDFLRLKLWW